MKLRLSISTMLILFISMMIFSVPISAHEIGETTTTYTAVLNELELYRTLQNLPETALIDAGYSEKDIQRIKNVNYEDLLCQRAQLPDKTLLNMGYSSSEIEILRNYYGSPIEVGSTVYGLAGTLTADISCTSASTTSYKVSYKWEWDHCPFVVYIDAMGIRWVAIANDGLPVDVSAYSSKATVDYYYGSDIEITKTYTASDSNFASETNFNALTCTFSMTSNSQIDDPAYALAGSLSTTIKRDSGVTRDIYYLKIASCYGHSIINIGAPTVSYTPGDTNIGFSFTGGFNIDNIGIKKYKIYTNCTKEAIDA